MHRQNNRHWTFARIVCACALIVAGLAHALSGALPPADATSVPLSGRLTGVKAVAAGREHTCALLESGAVKCWGNNVRGQLGNGSTTRSDLPVSVSGISNATHIAAMDDSTCVVLAGGGVKCWGDNGYGELGTGDPSFAMTPQVVPSLTDVIDIAGGAHHVCARRGGSELTLCWGANSFSQMGIDTGINSSDQHVTQVHGPQPQSAMGLGSYHTCFSNGTSTECWGANFRGQLGRSTFSNQEFATGASIDIANVVAIDGGYDHTCATQFAFVIVMSCWGRNTYGGLGIGSAGVDIAEPQAVTGLRLPVKDISLGYAFTCARLIDDTLQCWGINGQGQLGDGTQEQRNAPVDVIDLADVVQFSAGQSHVCAVLSSGEVKCWGKNVLDGVAGLLGTGDADQDELWTPRFVITTASNPVQSVDDLGDILTDMPTSGADPYEYGDAPDQIPGTPDSVNAYPGVPGRFPTLDGVATKGPKHANADQYFLGERTTIDAPVDADGLPNIYAASLVANLDGGDDGWLNRESFTQAIDCQPITLRVRVRRALTATIDAPLYLNAWFDGNRDGDWRDSRGCETGGRAYEWIVQDARVNTLPAPGGYVDVDVTTQRLLSNARGDPAWLRITLSDRKAISPTQPAGALPDGRGPSADLMDYGETEDYLWDPVTPRERYGEWSITKSIAGAGTPNVGDVYTYSIEIARIGGSQTNVLAALVDVLPAPLDYAGGPVLSTLAPTVSVLRSEYQPGYGGPNGRVAWVGSLTAGARLGLRFSGRVATCPGQPITNTAVLLLPADGRTLTATHVLTLPCVPLPPPVLTLSKQIVADIGSTAPPSSAPLDQATFLLTLSQSGASGDMAAAIVDALPPGLRAVEISASGGAVTITNGGRAIAWTGIVGPSVATQPVWVKTALIDLSRCDVALDNVAYWAARNTNGAVLRGASGAVTFDPACAPPPRPTNTPVPVATNTSVPLPTDAPPGAPTNTAVPRATNTPVPLPPATNTPVPVLTNTPVPLPTDAPPGAPTNTPVPRATNTPVPVEDVQGMAYRAMLPLMARAGVDVSRLQSAADVVAIGAAGFTPNVVTITVGASVTWRNDDSKTQMLYATQAGINGVGIAPGASHTHSFDRVGAFTVFALPGERGMRVIVQATGGERRVFLPLAARLR